MNVPFGMRTQRDFFAPSDQRGYCGLNGRLSARDGLRRPVRVETRVTQGRRRPGRRRLTPPMAIGIAKNATRIPHAGSSALVSNPTRAATRPGRPLSIEIENDTTIHRADGILTRANGYGLRATDSNNDADRFRAVFQFDRALASESGSCASALVRPYDRGDPGPWRRARRSPASPGAEAVAPPGPVGRADERRPHRHGDPRRLPAPRGGRVRPGAPRDRVPLAEVDRTRDQPFQRAGSVEPCRDCHATTTARSSSSQRRCGAERCSSMA